MSCAPCQGILQHFDGSVAHRELRRFRRLGLTSTPRPHLRDGERTSPA